MKWKQDFECSLTSGTKPEHSCVTSALYADMSNSTKPHFFLLLEFNVRDFDARRRESIQYFNKDKQQSENTQKNKAHIWNSLTLLDLSWTPHRMGIHCCATFKYYSVTKSQHNIDKWLKLTQPFVLCGLANRALRREPGGGGARYSRKRVENHSVFQMTELVCVHLDLVEWWSQSLKSADDRHE